MEPGTTNDGQMTAAVKEEAVPHVTHTFEWHISGKKTMSVTCNKAGTVEESLRQSSQFRVSAEKLKNKELVIVRDGRAISSHCPCSLIGNASLTLKYIKAGQVQHGSVHRHRKRPSGELVMFNVLTKGGKNVVKIMKNPAIKSLVQEITVYAYKGEKVRKALKRDGRFLSTVFKKNCVLSHTSTEVNTEMSNLVDDLDGKTYKIILLNKCDPLDSQPSSLDDAYMTENESQRADTNENHDPQQSNTNKSVIDNKPKKKRRRNNHAPPGKILREITNLNKTGKTEVSKLSPTQQLVCVEYGKRAHTCMDIKAVTKLIELSGSVCQVRINGIPEGSGFLLFSKFVLTNAHVLKDIYSENRCQLEKRVTVDFSQEKSEGAKKSEVEVKEVALFKYSNSLGNVAQCDWALLRLSTDEKLPDCLLTHFGFPPQNGGISIIGHPDGGLKKVDPCLIIPPDQRIRAVAKRCRGNQWSQFQACHVSDPIHPNSPFLTYDTCCHHGSSGSPVFDKHCSVVAMHTGGYHYEKEKGQKRYIMEFGYHLSFVIEHMIVQMVQSKRFDVLKAYLACKYAGHENMMNNVKKLVESRNITEFQNGLNSAEAGNDERLKMFFEFFCQKEEPESMDIDEYSN